MSKILVIPSTLSQIKKYKDNVDGFIIGIKDMCVNTPYCISNLDILNYLNSKDIFISLNKNYHCSELNKLEKLLNNLNNYNIKGVLFYDLAVLSLYKKMNLKYDLVWAGEHATTNYNTINYYYNLGVNYAYISNDITKEEIKDIIKNTKAKTMALLFGYLPMFVSKRHIVKNYLEYFNLADNSNINYMEKEGAIYPVVDNNNGTEVYSSNILNGIKESINLKLDYIILNSFNISSSKFTKVIDYFTTVNKSNLEEYESKINSMFKNIDYGFLYTETIYKVKNNEK